MKIMSCADFHRCTWEAHRGGHWASVVASGIPFGLGIFSLFVSPFSVLSEGLFLNTSDSSPRSLTSSMSIKLVLQPQVSPSHSAPFKFQTNNFR